MAAQDVSRGPEAGSRGRALHLEALEPRILLSGHPGSSGGIAPEELLSAQDNDLLFFGPFAVGEDTAGGVEEQHTTPTLQAEVSGIVQSDLVVEEAQHSPVLASGPTVADDLWAHPAKPIGFRPHVTAPLSPEEESTTVGAGTRGTGTTYLGWDPDPDYFLQDGYAVNLSWDVASAPENATVTSIDYWLWIGEEDAGQTDFWCMDYIIAMSSAVHGEDWSYFRAWDNDGFATDQGYDDDTANDYDIDLSGRTTNAFNGETVNQRWYWYFGDYYLEGDGEIAYVEFWIHYQYDEGQPDLTVPAARWQASSVSEGDAFWVEVDVSNGGDTTADPSYVNAWLSTDDDFDTSDDYDLGTQYVDALAAGGTSTERWDIASFPDLGSGSYSVWVVAEADYYNDVAESNENNVFKSTTSFTGTDAPFPDLTVPAARWQSASVIEGDSFWIECDVSNDGAVAAGASYVNAWLSTDNDFDTSDDYDLGMQSVGALSPGATSTEHWDIASFPDIGSGSYSVWVVFEADCADDVVESDESNVFKATSSFTASGGPSGWVVAYYLSHGNNLDAYQAAKFASVALGAAGSAVQPIVLYDFLDSTQDAVFEISAGLTDPGDYTRNVNMWWTSDVGLGSEASMGDDATLSGFMNWVVDQYPSEDYALVLFDHGDGWKSVSALSRDSEAAPLGVCWDGTDYLTTAELGAAFAAIDLHRGSDIEVTHFDACLMQMMEVGYEIREHTDYMVGNMNLGWATGPTYEENYLLDITVATTAEELAVDIATEYHTLLANWPPSAPGTDPLGHAVSVLNMAEMGAVCGYLDDLVTSLGEAIATPVDPTDVDHFAEVRTARANTQKYDEDGDLGQDIHDAYVDLKHFAQRLQVDVTGSDTGAVNLRAAAQALETAMDSDFVVYVAHTDASGFAFPNALGPSIYLPEDESHGSLQYYNEGILDFCNGTWDEFLDAYLPADLTAPQAWWQSTEITEGEPFWIRFKVENRGSTGAGSSDVRAYLSTDNDLDTSDDYALAVQAVGALSSGASQEIQWDFTMPDLGSGSYTVWLLAEVDYYDAVTEYYEDNTWKIFDGFTANDGEPGPTQWTFMVYLAADNNLEDAGIDDFLEMASVGSNGDMNIVVQFDRIAGYSTLYDDWTDTRRGLIMFGDEPDLNWGTSIGEVNMGDPNTLSDFADWAISAYPAESYALILWDHGGGWRGSSPSKDACWDDTDGSDYLENREVGSALAAVPENMDLFGYDCCLMGMLEVAHEVRNEASVLVASEQTEPWDGWPYDTILADLAASPTWTAAELAADVVVRYGESYGGAETLSAIDLSVVGDAYPNGLSTAVSELASTTVTDATQADYDLLESHRTNSAYFYSSDYRDLGTFLANAAGDGSLTSSISAAAQTALDAYNAAVIQNHSGPTEGATGLSIYFQASGNAPDPDYNNSIISFAADTQWDEFLSWWEAGVGADLEGTEFSVDPGQMLGTNSTNVTFCICNSGNENAGAFDVEFFWSDDTDFANGEEIAAGLDPSDPNYDPANPNAYHVTGGLSAGGDLADTIVISVPRVDPLATDGIYYLGMRLDESDAVSESDEANNHSRGLGLDMARVNWMQAIYVADFEDSEGGYEDEGFTYVADPDAAGTNLWHATSNRGTGAHSGPHSQYYGLEDVWHYDTGLRNAGYIVSPPISLSGVGTPVVLSFEYFLATEGLAPSYDVATVEVSDDGGVTWSAVADNASGGGLADPTSDWTTWQGCISAYAGSEISVRFNFDTEDGLDNYFEGWYVDDVTILASAPTLGFQEPTIGLELLGVPAELTAREDEAFTYDFDTPIEAAGGSVSYLLLDAPVWLGMENPGAGVISGVPTNARVGDFEVTLRTAKPSGTYVDHALALRVLNAAPTITSEPPALTVVAGVPYAYQVTSDDDPTTTYALLDGPPELGIDPGRGLIAGTFDGSAAGEHLVRVQVDDGHGGTDVQAFTLTVLGTDPSFVQPPAQLTATEDEAFTYNFDTDDEAGTGVTYVLIGAPGWLSVQDESAGVVAGIPADGDVGEFQIAIRAEDGYGGRAEHTFTLSVVNVPPRFLDPPTELTAVQRRPFRFDFQTDDELPGGGVRYELAEGPSWLRMANRSRGLVLGVPRGAAGKYPVTVVAQDSHGAAAEHTFSLTVQQVETWWPPRPTRPVPGPPSTGQLSAGDQGRTGALQPDVRTVLQPGTTAGAVFGVEDEVGSLARDRSLWWLDGLPVGMQAVRERLGGIGLRGGSLASVNVAPLDSGVIPATAEAIRRTGLADQPWAWDAAR